MAERVTLEQNVAYFMATTFAELYTAVFS